MSIQDVKNLVTSKLARQVLFGKKHSPKILFAAGVVGVVGATVLACRATLKMDEVLEEHEKKVADANNLHHDMLGDNPEQVDVNVHNKEIAKLKIRTGLEIAGLYAPSVVLYAASIAALTGSHVILTKRNGTLVAGFAALDKAYREYRKRVVDEYGVDADHKFATGAETVEVEEQTAEGKTIKRTANKVTGRFGGSPYAICFDESTSKKWSREPGRNQMTIQMQQSFANDLLRTQGYVFLNDVYEMLGLRKTAMGQMVGWVYRRDNEEGAGDNYVDFGIYATNTEDAKRFVAGAEHNVWLDFNVDGEIVKLAF